MGSCIKDENFICVFSFIISFKVAEDLSTKVYVFRERLGVSEPELCEQHSISRFTASELSALEQRWYSRLSFQLLFVTGQKVIKKHVRIQVKFQNLAD